MIIPPKHVFIRRFPRWLPIEHKYSPLFGVLARQRILSCAAVVFVRQVEARLPIMLVSGMSACGPQRTRLRAISATAFGGKAAARSVRWRGRDWTRSGHRAP